MEVYISMNDLYDKLKLNYFQIDSLGDERICIGDKEI